MAPYSAFDSPRSQALLGNASRRAGTLLRMRPRVAHQGTKVRSRASRNSMPKQSLGTRELTCLVLMECQRDPSWSKFHREDLLNAPPLSAFSSRILFWARAEYQPLVRRQRRRKARCRRRLQLAALVVAERTRAGCGTCPQSQGVRSASGEMESSSMGTCDCGSSGKNAVKSPSAGRNAHTL